LEETHDFLLSSYLTTLLHKYPQRRTIRLIEINTKCRHLKKFTCKATLRQMFI
jgi:hypothetical protein